MIQFFGLNFFKSRLIKQIHINIWESHKNYTSLKNFFLNHNDTLTKAISTGTSTNGPITVVKATGEAKPNVAIATASANSKLFPAAVKEIAAVFG
ncbi:hypothetical protein D3C72_1891730 [compost metagenome]